MEGFEFFIILKVMPSEFSTFLRVTHSGKVKGEKHTKSNFKKSSKMNSLNDNICIASDVAQNKKARLQNLNRGAYSKSKLHSPPQVDCN